MPAKRLPLLLLTASIVTLSGILFSGCAGQQKALEEELAQRDETIKELQTENTELHKQIQEKDKASEGLKDVEESREMLEAALAGTGATVTTRAGEIVVSLPSVKLFGPGRYKLKKAARKPLSRVAREIKRNFPYATIRVEGHTDNTPIKKLKNRFRSNWELSAARAASVLHFFIERGHIDPKHIYLAGFGAYHPVTSNSTASGRQKNRRVEIVVLTGENAGGI